MEVCLALNIVPIVIAFIAGFINILGTFFDIRTIHIPALLVFLICLFGLRIIKYRLTYFSRYIIPTFAVIFFIHLIRLNGFAILSSGGYVIIFATVFAACFDSSRGISIFSLLRGITRLYQFYIVTLLAEFVLVMLGFQSNLVQLFASVASPGYKGYNGADVLHLLGFGDINGLNSILFGSQIAGMLSLFSTIWFIMLVKGLPKYMITRHGNLWLNLSIFLYLITTNLTNTILLILAFVLYQLSSRRSIKLLKLIYLAIIITGLVAVIGYSGIFDRIFTNDNKVLNSMASLSVLEESGYDIQAVKELSTLKYYIYITLLPTKLWLKESLSNKLFGISKELVLNNKDFVSGDFALGFILYKSGIMWVMVFLIAVIFICMPALKFYKIAGAPNETLQAWTVCCASNALISVLFLASLIHYDQATSNPGAFTLFSLHLGATIYSRYRCKGYQKPYRHIEVPPYSDANSAILF
jgi:hypothetical protein